jgi:hypothetical protein
VLAQDLFFTLGLSFYILNTSSERFLAFITDYGLVAMGLVFLNYLITSFSYDICEFAA